MAYTTGPDGATATITEDQAIRMRQLSRRLCVMLREMEEGVTALMGVARQKDLYELESIPVLLDMADENAREMLQLFEGVYNEF